MKKMLLFVALIAFAICAKAHNVDSVFFIKTPALPTGGVTTHKDTTVVPFADTLWYQVLVCNDSNFAPGTVTTGPWDSSIDFAYTKTVPADTTYCFAKIVTKKRDTTHLFVFDTTQFVVMSKPPTGSVTYTSSTDSIYYNLDVKGGNNNEVPVVIQAFSDTTCAWSVGLSTTYYVSGPSNFNFIGAVRAHFSSGVSYCVRITVTNPITGSAVLKQNVTTSTPFTTVPYLEWTTDTIAHTDRSATFYPGVNCFGRNAMVNINWKKVTETGWHVTHVPIDTTVTGLQTPVVVIDSFTASTDYMYYLSATNIVGPVNLGMKYFTTDDTVLGSSTGILSLTSVSATYNGTDSIIFKDYLTNAPDGTATINSQVTKNGLFFYSIDPTTSAIDHGIIKNSFPIMGDTGTFQISTWVYDDLGSTDSVGGYVLYARVMTVYVGNNSTAVVNIPENKNVHGKVIFFDELGTKINEYECMFGEIYKFVPKQIHIVCNFVSDDNKFIYCHKIFVQ